MRTFLIASLTAVLLLVPSFSAVDTIPSQLTDDAFWKIVTDSSEPSGAFLSENFLSNERGFQYVLPSLVPKIQPGGVYLGVGPEQNFTYIAAFHPKMAFIVDIRRQNMIEHLLYKAVFELSPNRVEFLSRLFSRDAPPGLTADSRVEDLFSGYSTMPLDPMKYQQNLQAVKDLLLKQHKLGLSADDESSLDHVYGVIAKAGTNLGYSVTNSSVSSSILDLLGGTRRYTGTGVFGDVLPFVAPTSTDLQATPIPASTVAGMAATFPSYSELMAVTDGSGKNWNYLATEGNYKTVRDMQLKNLIVPLVGDFAGPKAIRAVGQYLKDHNAEASLFYLSNVEQYLTPTATLVRFYDNVATLPLNSSSSFIRSAQGTGAQPGIVQSSTSSIRDVLDAVLAGRVLSSDDILRLPH